MHYRVTRQDDFSSNRSHINYYHSTQTLITLNLSGNNVGAEGVRHMAHALQSNIVSKFFPHQSDAKDYLSIQTLTVLNLENNGIVAEGAQHVTNALESNTVRQNFVSLITYRP
jgi:Ran GTPase-activating protein (RanGAP) involved in mRNA processing and transport